MGRKRQENRDDFNKGRELAMAHTATRAWVRALPKPPFSLVAGADAPFN